MGDLGKLVLYMSAVLAAHVAANSAYEYMERKDLEWRSGRKFTYHCGIRQERAIIQVLGKMYAYTRKEEEYCEYNLPALRRINP